MSISLHRYAPRGSSAETRLSFRTRKTDSCWFWEGHRNTLGYGVIRHQRKTWLAHRLSYAVRVGPIPHGLLVCHNCDNPSCVRPDHLVLGTDRDNTADSVWRGRARKARGEIHLSAKLTEQDVRKIRQEEQGYGYAVKLANEFGVSVSAIQKIRQNITWRHLL